MDTALIWPVTNTSNSVSVCLLLCDGHCPDLTCNSVSVSLLLCNGHCPDLLLTVIVLLSMDTTLLWPVTNSSNTTVLVCYHTMDTALIWPVPNSVSATVTNNMQCQWTLPWSDLLQCYCQSYHAMGTALIWPATVTMQWTLPWSDLLQCYCYHVMDTALTWPVTVLELPCNGHCSYLTCVMDWAVETMSLLS